MGVSKVNFSGKTLVDLTGDTVNEQSLLSGYTAHNKAGEKITGAYAPKLQSKSVTPTNEVQTVYPDAGFDGLYAVSVGAAQPVPTGSVTFSTQVGINRSIYILAYKKAITITYNLRDTYLGIAGYKMHESCYAQQILDRVTLRGNSSAAPTPITIDAGYDIIVFSYSTKSVTNVSITVTYQ